MKAIVIHQPWAWAIMAGHKKYENRTWSTNHRGPLAIVAGVSRARLLTGTSFCQKLGIEVPTALPLGRILGVVNVVDVMRPSPMFGLDPFAEGPWCWVLESPRLLDQPIPYRGQMGLFDIAASPQTENLEAIAASLWDVRL